MDLKSLILDIYDEENTQLLLAGIGELKHKYMANTDHSLALDEADVALITYADQFSSGNQSKLNLLHQVLNEYLGNAISVVHLLPFYPYTSDDGFAVSDFNAVREDIGGWADIEQLSKDYHLMFDAVINHMSSKSEWFLKYLSGDPLFKKFFVEEEGFRNLERVVRPRTSPLFHSYGNEGKKVWTTFSEDQVDLDYRNPRVSLAVIEVLLFYLSKGARLLRLDAIGFLWKADDTTCIHLPQTHALIKLMRKVSEELNYQTFFITETNVPHQENISYFGAGDEAHMVYNFTLPPLLAYSLLNEDTTKLVQWFGTLSLDHPGTCFFNFLASHDGVGLRPVQGILSDTEVETLTKSASANGGKISYRTSDGGKSSPYEINCNYLSLLKGEEARESLGFRRFLLAHAILLAMPGLPAIYFHSLFGSENDLKAMEEGKPNRAINREKFDYEAFKLRMQDKEGIPSKVLQRLKEYIQEKQQNRDFHPYASHELIKSQSGVFAFRRGEKTSTFFNLTLEPRSIELTTSGIDSITGQDVPQGSFQLPPLSFLWHKATDV